MSDAIDLEVIGIAPNDDPICINKNGNVIIVMEDSTFQYMNSSLLIMLQTLIYYSEYMDIALEKEGNPILLKSFVKKMQEKINVNLDVYFSFYFSLISFLRLVPPVAVI